MDRGYHQYAMRFLDLYEQIRKLGRKPTLRKLDSYLYLEYRHINDKRSASSRGARASRL